MGLRIGKRHHGRRQKLLRGQLAVHPAPLRPRIRFNALHQALQQRADHERASALHRNFQALAACAAAYLEGKVAEVQRTGHCRASP